MIPSMNKENEALTRKTLPQRSKDAVSNLNRKIQRYFVDIEERRKNSEYIAVGLGFPGSVPTWVRNPNWSGKGTSD